MLKSRCVSEPLSWYIRVRPRQGVVKKFRNFRRRRCVKARADLSTRCAAGISPFFPYAEAPDFFGLSNSTRKYLDVRKDLKVKNTPRHFTFPSTFVYSMNILLVLKLPGTLCTNLTPGGD